MTVLTGKLARSIPLSAAFCAANGRAMASKPGNARMMPVYSLLKKAKEPLMCRHCEEQSDEAICNSLIHWLRDCFAPLAMTSYMN